MSSQNFGVFPDKDHSKVKYNNRYAENPLFLIVLFSLVIVALSVKAGLFIVKRPNGRATILILAVVLLILGLWGHSHLRYSSPLYNLFLPPDDLYIGSAHSPFDLSVEGLEKDLKFTAKYPGSYHLSIEVESSSGEFDGLTKQVYVTDFQVQIQILGEKGILSERLISDFKLVEFGRGDAMVNKKGALILEIYKVPIDFPINQPLTIKATVIKSSPDFRVKYSNQRIMISKGSDL